MFAFTQTLLAFPLPPAAVFRSEERRVGKERTLTGMSDVEEKTVEPVAADGIVTVQEADAPPTAQGHVFGPTKLPGPVTFVAVAGCGPASVAPPRALTVIVSTWFELIGLVAFAGVIWMFAFTQTLLAFPLPPAAVF